MSDKAELKRRDRTIIGGVPTAGGSHCETTALGVLLTRWARNRGIRTATKRVQSWFDRVENPGRDLAAIATLMERAGTGGALFRNLYRDFLTECQGLLDGGPCADLVERGRISSPNRRGSGRASPSSLSAQVPQ